METRDKLHRLVDQLPDNALQRAESALNYCLDPERHHVNIEQAKRRVLERSQQRLREMSEKYGHGFISGIGSGTGMTEVTGDHHSTMIAYEDGRDATFHLYVYRGNTFEIIETVEISGDGQKIIRRERFTAPDGTEQTLVAELPIAKPK